MHMPYDQLPDPTDKFTLLEELGTGFCAKVWKARDLQNSRIVAIKIQPYDREHQFLIEEEYRIFRDHSGFPNLPDFYGTYKKQNSAAPDDIWFILQYCDGGTAVEMVNKLLSLDKKMKEEHIAFILKETAKAAIELNRNHFIHRDIRGSNILLTKNGEVKLSDFGLTREVDSTFGKTGTCIGSPCWMAPEIVTAPEKKETEIYDSRSDVWALGITAIELADGKPPFADMHPTRAMFQIVRNPPPTLIKQSAWSQNFLDFIAECLEKNPENRAHMLEIVEHPFLNETFENEVTMQKELKILIEKSEGGSYRKPEEVLVDRGFIKKYNSKPEKMLCEDLAAIDNVADSIVLETLAHRMSKGISYTFIGDILLSLNSNEIELNMDESFHEKYKFKSRSENAPHIFSVADLAYQDMMHHKVPQHVIFAGETYSGKSTNVHLFIKHLCYLGGGNKGATTRIENALKAILMLTNAGTPINNNSTRCNIQYHITFGTTGKMSGAVFILNLLEKYRVSTTDMNQHNFHIFYYFYDWLVSENKHKDYKLKGDRNYRYLRVPQEKVETKLKYVRDTPKENAEKYKEFEEILLNLDMSEINIQSVRNILAAILIIGNIRFKSESKGAELEDSNIVTKICDLLKVDEKKFQWSLTQYIKVKGGIAERCQYTPEEARDARDALAATIYCRFVDWVVAKINMNLAFARAVFGDSNAIVIYDMFGFECFHRNDLQQLIVNTMNEQMQYHYNQKTFALEMFEQEADEVPPVQLNYHDNKDTLDRLLTKPEGLFYKFDDATKDNLSYESIADAVIEKRSAYIKMQSNNEIAVAHYTGKVVYDLRVIPDQNRDFVPPEMIESLRTSLDETIKLLFTNQLTKTGNLTMDFETEQKQEGKQRTYVLNTLSRGQYSQATNLRTISAQFRSVCLEMMKLLSTKQSDVGFHFIRCIRADLEYAPRNFHPDMVQQQMKALAVMDTIIARQQGYSSRISYHEFLKRYQFLAFDFDETVDVTKDNCRLLLIRLKMEGWAIGKSKVFLRYYNDEFLSRLYEIQVKKIIKVQSMMRSYISRRRMKEGKRPLETKPATAEENEAATTIQKVYRGYRVRAKYGPLCTESGNLNLETAQFLRSYTRKWRSKSLFQVLLHYRAARFIDFTNLSQQVHFFNQKFVSQLLNICKGVNLDKINVKQVNVSAFGPVPLPTRKLPFRLQDIPYFDTTYMCDPVNPISRMKINTTEPEEEPWDAPLQMNPSLTAYLMTYNAYKKEQSCQTNWDKLYESDNVLCQPFVRDPNMMKKLGVIARSNQYGGDIIPSSASRTSQFDNQSGFNPYTNFNSNRNFNNQTGFNQYTDIRSNFNQYDPNMSNLGLLQQNYNENSMFSGNNQNLMKDNFNQSQNQRYSNYSNIMVSQGTGGSRSGSRRNSIKNYAAPLPPHMQKNNDASIMNRSRNYNNNIPVNRDFRPPNHVSELKMLGRNFNSDNNYDNDNPPFNFKSMLRKTNYSRPEDTSTFEYNSRGSQNNENSTTTNFSQVNKFKSSETNSRSWNRDNPKTNNYSSSNNDNSKQNNSNSGDNEFQTRYVDEEIAPGVKLSGYAIDI
ncbi:neither inactivation nor afterpotential protein C [Condylostylus longicornis]|uniref:neither inactivation nor afterpotential protein C n=1 Tax=Condylostylus longicornis TaxID=2530218 RepID=UPI00244DE86A|nr:neither inactivation nor afterpotential protein C [Condylostylus longicornis]